MERKIIKTDDGSTTIQLADWGECYHSKHGAIQEAYHVFIKNGLSLLEDKSVSILEIGFGTGLNAFITFLESKQRDLTINYVGVEGGYAWFVAPNIAVTPKVRYNIATKDTYESAFQGLIGFSLFF